MNETGAELNFDRAEYAEGPAARPPCDVCKKDIGAQYWQWQQRSVCANCRAQIEAAVAKSQSGASFGKALLLGGATALACGIAYAIFAGLTGYHVALVTIGIAYLVAKVVRKASGGIGGVRYQVLAVVLTYVASTMGYLPGIAKSAMEGGNLDFTVLSLVAGYTLAAPFLELFSAPLGMLIVAFGLWEAWKRTRGVPIVIDGPYNVAPARAEPTAAG